MAYGYCPKCGSRLYPADEEYMQVVGVCGDCVSFDKPNGRYKQAWHEHAVAKARKEQQAKKRGRK